MMARIITLTLFLRALIDIAYTDEKPIAIVFVYSLLIVGSSFSLFMHGKTSHALKSLVLFSLTTISLLISSIYNKITFINHLYFSIQILIPILFLLFSSTNQETLREAGISFRRFCTTPLLFFVLLAAYFDYKKNGDMSLGVIEYYANNPNHVLAQTALKISLPIILDDLVIMVFCLLILLFLNVRSAIASYFLAILPTFSGRFRDSSKIMKLGIIIGSLGFLLLIYLNIDHIYDRLILKGRALKSDDSVISQASSGRIEMYKYYFDYLLNKFQIHEWLFGAGPIWLDASGETYSAHNDILNSVISFGLLGFSCILLCYIYVFATLPKKVRMQAFLAFLTLFLTNGVIFHQSNVYFALLYCYKKPAHRKLT